MNYTPLPLYKSFAMDAYILHKANMLITHHVSFSHGFYTASRDMEKDRENRRLASSERQNGGPKK